MASRILVFFFVLGLLSSCNTTSKVAYFQNVPDAGYKSTLPIVEAPIQKNDILTINISSLNTEASAVFNPAANTLATVGSTAGTQILAGGYLVNSDGNIQLPIIGTVTAAGLTKKELKESITNVLLNKKLLIDPIVDIRYVNFEVTVVGEVNKPTVITVPSEKISLLKALGLAGDLTIYGRRDNILLIRENNGERMTQHIDINSASFLSSPYYYLQPNDVVYVEPNKTKVASSSRSQQVVPIILSSLSIIVVVVTSLIK